MEYGSDSALSSPPSSPLSIRSKSPTPPCDYPSPSSTLHSGSRSPSKALDSSLGVADPDGPPPKKKRKLAEQKSRTTGYLDLHTVDEISQYRSSPNDEIQLQRLLKALRNKQKIVVIAGAGISVSAGSKVLFCFAICISLTLSPVPDFRSSTGLFKSLRGQHKLKASGKHLFDASVYRSNSSTSSFHDMIRELSHLTRNAQPTLFHHMLATLAEEGRLLRLYTQNVDGIDTSLEPLATQVPLNPKGPWPKTIQLHGGLEKMVCTKCGALSDFDSKLFDGPEAPLCKPCEDMESARALGERRSHGVGRLRPRIVLYNEFNPEEEAIGAVTRADLRSRPDAVIVVGTSLKIPGVRRITREMCAVTRGRRDGFTAWINNDPEPMGNEFKDCWDLVVRGDCEEVARQVALPKWNDKDIGIYNTVSDDIAKVTTKVKTEVILEGKHKIIEKTQGILTPVASPRHQSPAPPNLMAKTKTPKLKFKPMNGTASSLKHSKLTSTGTARKKTSKKAITTKPSNKITNAFTVTKTKPAFETPAKAPPSHVEPALFPNLINKQPATPMRPLSPVEVRNNSETCTYSPLDRTYSPHDDDSALLNEQLAIDVSNSLYSDQAHQQKRETISPKGNLPNGMTGLIDVV
jgi:NAD+-dependent protein deacetylase SIR2